MTMYHVTMFHQTRSSKGAALRTLRTLRPCGPGPRHRALLGLGLFAAGVVRSRFGEYVFGGWYDTGGTPTGGRYTTRPFGHPSRVDLNKPPPVHRP